MRIPNAAHESRPWRIREIAPDFTLEDVWALPVHGGADDFQAALELLSSLDPANAGSLPTRVLWRLRDRLGKLVRPRQDLGRRATRRRRRAADSGHERNLADRPAAGRSAGHGARTCDFGSLPFAPALPHRRRVRRGAVEPDRARRDAPGLGRPGRRPLSGADGRLRQAARPLREGLHGADQAVPPLDRLSGAHAPDRTDVAQPRARPGDLPAMA